MFSNLLSSLYNFFINLFSTDFSSSNVICHIFFYEWSNINNIPLYFDNLDSFILYLVNSNILYDKFQYNYLLENCDKYLYCGCLSGDNHLLLFDNFVDLRDCISKY